MKKLEFQKYFGKHLKKVRREKGISLRELEYRSDIDRSLLSKMENGLLNPTVFTIHKICEALELTTEDFYRGLK